MIRAVTVIDLIQDLQRQLHHDGDETMLVCLFDQQNTGGYVPTDEQWADLRKWVAANAAGDGDALATWCYDAFSLMVDQYQEKTGGAFNEPD
jgi:hypothetical protein